MGLRLVRREDQVNVKCPGCGFVSFPDVERCKNCGYEFQGAKQDNKTAGPKAAVGEVLLFEGHAVPMMEKLSSSRGDRSWADELPERGAGYHRRRAGSRVRFDARVNPKLDFEHDAPGGRQALAEAELGAERAAKPPVDLTFGAVERPRRADVDPGTISLQPAVRPPAPRERRSGDLELSPKPAIAPTPALLKRQAVADREPALRSAQMVADEDGELPVASAAQRFFAGLADAALILLCWGVFAAIFLVSGGHLHPGLFTFVIAGLIAAALIFGYFGSFAAITHATPGDQWRGIGIRNLAGEVPTTGQSLLRAFGYLVAAAAFMIGFLWVLMDSNGMGWHDHMSGTVPLALGPYSRSVS